MVRICRRPIVMCALALFLAAVSCRSHKSAVDAPQLVSYYEEAYVEVTPGASEEPAEPGEGSALKAELERWMGVPYRYSGHSLEGTDCSGLVVEVYAAVYGVVLPHHSADIFAQCCDEVSREELLEGDLVFFSFVRSGRISHVGVYIGDGRFVHASSSRGVVVSDMRDPYYVRGYVASGRVRLPGD